tara:strand:- start:293 stop:934 length:642 start_codon:yes stop_codon:yes gene_type:complete
MNRPYRKTYLWKLKEAAKENWHSLPELEKILLEIGLRKNRDANLEFECELGKRLEYLKNQEVERKKIEEIQQREQFQQEGYFPWPTTDAPASQYGLSGEVYWYKDGLLSYVGYKVGNDGKSKKVRQNILNCVFYNDLPHVNSKQYMSEWGDKQTSNRLRKMAEVIATLTRNAKRRDASMNEAIRNWEEDLDYLYNEYYVDKFHFSWPEPEDRI